MTYLVSKRTALLYETLYLIVKCIYLIQCTLVIIGVQYLRQYVLFWYSSHCRTTKGLLQQSGKASIIRVYVRRITHSTMYEKVSFC